MRKRTLYKHPLSKIIAAARSRISPVKTLRTAKPVAGHVGVAFFSFITYYTVNEPAIVYLFAWWESTNPTTVMMITIKGDDQHFIHATINSGCFD